MVGSDTCCATTNVRHCCVAMATLSVITILLILTKERQQYKRNALLRAHGSISSAYVPQCKVALTLPVLLEY